MSRHPDNFSQHPTTRPNVRFPFQFSLRDLFYQQWFLLQLFDLPDFLERQCSAAQKRRLEDGQHFAALKKFYAQMRAAVQKRVDHNNFNKVDLTQLFQCFKTVSL